MVHIKKRTVYFCMVGDAAVRNISDIKLKIVFRTFESDLLPVRLVTGRWEMGFFVRPVIAAVAAC